MSKDHLYEQYIKQEKPISQIALEVGCCRSTIDRKLKEYGIEKRQSKSGDLTGQKFGDWTVIGKTRKGLCEARCSCGTTKLVHAYSLMCGKTKKCYFCRDNLKNGQQNPKWTGHELISGAIWRQYRWSAEKRNIPFQIDIKDAWKKYEAQKRKCALSGVDIEFSKNITDHHAGCTTASLDRIDSTGTYSKENVQWVHKTINRMKNTVPEKDFIYFCIEVARTKN